MALIRRLACGLGPAVALGGWRVGCEHENFGSKEEEWLERSMDHGRYYDVSKGRPLGVGAFANVYKARDLVTGERVALKKVKQDDGCVAREVRALTRVRERGEHPHIASLVDFWKEGRTKCVATQLVEGGELFDYLVAQGCFSERRAAELLRGAASALAWLHENGVVHADVKPENMCLTRERTIKLIDFGSALLDGATPSAADAMRCYGTAHYSPPELLDARFGPRRDATRAARSYANPALDAWALGIVLFIVLVGAHPFDPRGDVDDPSELAASVLSSFDDETGLPTAPLRDAKVQAFLSPAALDLLHGLLARQPKDRLRLVDALNHPWFNGAAGATEKLTMPARAAARSRRLKQRFEACALDHLVQRDATSDVVADFVDKVVVHEDAAADSTSAEVSHSAEATEQGPPRELLDALSAEASELGSLRELLGALHLEDRWRRGDVVFAEGDDAGEDAAMYFIARGAVDVSIHGRCVSHLQAGDFFGEGGLLFRNDSATRHATVRVASSTAKLIAVKRSDIDRLSIDARTADQALKAVALDRALQNAQAAIAAAAADAILVGPGECCCRQGECGNEVFSIESGTFHVLQTTQRGGDLHKVAELRPKDFFGEAAVLSDSPRSASVVCVDPNGCVCHSLTKRAFLELLKRDMRTDFVVRHLHKDRRDAT